MTTQMLFEDQGHTILELVEAAGPGKRMVARGKFGECDKPTANGRIYGKKLMAREVARLQEALAARRVTGSLDHPADGKMSLSNTSHLVTKLWIEDDGTVMGEAEILGTDAGRNLRALVEGRVAVGVSSRGNGTTTPRKDEAGEDVNDDYQLATYDFVADPAVRDALPQVTLEHVEGPEPTLAERVAAEWPEAVAELTEAARRDAAAQAQAAVAQAVAEAEARVRAELQEGVERRLAAALVEARGTIHAAVVEEIQADPATADARAVLAGIAELVGAYRQAPDEAAVREALAARDAALAEAEARHARADAQAAAAVVRAHVWERLVGHPHGGLAGELLRDVPLGEDVAAADARVDAVLARLPAVVEERARDAAALLEAVAAAEARAAAAMAEAATLREQAASWTEKADGLDEKVRKLTELSRRAIAGADAAQAEVARLTEALEGAEAAAAEAAQRATLAEAKLEKVAGLGNGRQVLRLLEGAQSAAEVERVVRVHGRQALTEEDLAAQRRAATRGRAAAPPLQEAHAVAAPLVDADGTVLDGDELARLMGVVGQ